jgi:hypothetical protein
MTIKLEAAYHEAGHAVVAQRSRFHAIVGPIDLREYGAGEIFISLSSRRLLAAGKKAHPSSQADKEVATDLSIILCAGLAAERLAAENDPSLSPNEECSKPDRELAEQQLAGAGIENAFSHYEPFARMVLLQNWACTQALAELLYEKTALDAEQIIEFIVAQPPAVELVIAK